MKQALTAAVIAVAVAAGLWLAAFDARTDDTGIEAGLLLLVAAGLAAIRPRVALVIALLVGGPIPLAETMRTGGFGGGVAALGFSVAGALAGAYLGVIARRSSSRAT